MNSDRYRAGGALRRRFSLERLEERCVLAASPLQVLAAWEAAGGTDHDLLVEMWAQESSAAPVMLFTPPADLSLQESSATGSAVVPMAPPFPLEDTFFLHSLPGATKTIYLDFTGFTTRNTSWNESFELPNIVTPPFGGDPNFSNATLMTIQEVWARVSEDFIPFNVNVTTQDPGIEALRRSGFGDNHWGIRVVIGGSSLDWYTPVTENVVGGVALGGSFNWDSDTPTFVFEEQTGSAKNVAEAASHEVGHTLGLGHDGQFVFVFDEEEEEWEREEVEYYAGHGAGPTGWAPIMGVGYSQELTQWSQGEYPLANNIQDDLMIITSFNGFNYRPDDHGNTIGSASPFGTTSTEFFAEGIIERNTDIDFFSFQIGSQGEAVTFQIDPYPIGPNLDILAKLYNSSGVEIAMSNPIDALDASFSLILQPGTYYLSVEGTGKPQTSPDDYGYTDYGSLGYYSISGTRKELMIGVDFDVFGGTRPDNWALYSGSPNPAVLTDLKNEAGFTTPYNLGITAGPPVTRVGSTINSGTLPDHFQPLDELGGYLASSSWTFTWSGLEPSSVFEVFVFGLSNGEGEQHVEIVGANSSHQFTQTLTAGDLFINREIGANNLELSDFARAVTSTPLGTIEITVTPEAGLAMLAGMALRPSKPGSIHGQKWNDLNGDGLKDPDEPGLAGWVIFIDDNDNGILDPSSQYTVLSPDVPQVILDYTTVKSELFFEGPRVIVDVDVLLNITHEYAADLDVYLISPSGTRVTLFEDVGVWGENFYDTILDDQATKSITSVTPLDAPFTGRFRPQQPLSVLNGEDPNGIWTLEISDDAGDHTGVLNHWSLTITAGERFTVTDADGNYSFDELPPGEYIIREVQQGDWTQTFASPPVTVTSGARVTDVDFGNWIPPILPGTIAGQKWHDENGDGVKDPGELGLAGWVIYLDANDNGILDPETTLTVVSEVPRPITDFSTVIAPLEFEGLGTIFNVEVTFDITHSFVGDLEAYLISPMGTQVKLFSRVGGQFNNFEDTTLADDAETWIVEGEAPFAGRYRPVGLLGDFIGEDPTGVWQLLIRDVEFGDEGTLNSWSLAITGSERFEITDEDGFYEFVDLRPGDYIVREVEPPGWAQTYPVIPTGETFWWVQIDGSGNVIGDIDFGNSAVATLPGDYTGSGVVDAAAYTVWRDGLGSTFAQADYDVWKANFGTTLAGSGNGSSLASAAAASAEAEFSSLAAAVALVEEAFAEEVHSPSNDAVHDQALAVLGDPSLPWSLNNDDQRGARPNYRPIGGLGGGFEASRLRDLLIAARGDDTLAELGSLVRTAREADSREAVENLFSGLEEELWSGLRQPASRKFALSG